MQNAVDAVAELEAWCEVHGKTFSSLELPDQEADVLIEFIEKDDKSWLLRVRDKGIGMSSDTIQKYFFRAGASFRQSADWAMEFLDEKGKPRVLRAGRFGVGAFAIFLLGPSFRLWTRHAGADKFMGYNIDVSADSQLVEIRRVDGLPVGTTIEVELTGDSVAELRLHPKKNPTYAQVPMRFLDWFCWDWPKVSLRVVSGAGVSILNQEYAAPLRKAKPGPQWSVIRPEDFDAVYWTFGKWPLLMCNGLRIAEPGC
jgi:molecular chaperone HtpG